MTTILPQEFFDRPVLEVCKDLLGKFIVKRETVDGKRTTSNVTRSSGTIERAFMITEIEAYDGMEDEACHARFGKTERNAPMFGKPGKWYVYLCYGMYRMLNIITGPGNHPSAILIRGIVSSPVRGLRVAKGRREPLTAIRDPKLNGPGKLTKHLGITKIYNGKPANKNTGLWIEDRGVMITKVTQKPRVGIDYAGKWKHKPRRFLINEQGIVNNE